MKDSVSVNKKMLLQRIIESLMLQTESFISAARTAHVEATDEASLAENKYDTRGLEASYLAEAQATMAAESAQNIASYKTLKLKDFSDNSSIALTALIELESEDGSRSFYFLAPNSGGTKIKYENIEILLITPSSPIGKKLIGCKKGDFLEIKSGRTEKEYEIISVC